MENWFIVHSKSNKSIFYSSYSTPDYYSGMTTRCPCSFLFSTLTQIYKCLLPTGEYVLKTRVYFKPTDTHQLLHTASNHPKHCCLVVSKSQFITFERIASSVEDYHAACDVISWRVLKTGGYAHSHFRTLWNEIWCKYTDSAKDATNRDIILVIAPFDGINIFLNGAIKKSIRENPHLGDAFRFRIKSAFQKHSNLRQLLIKNHWYSLR